MQPLGVARGELDAIERIDGLTKPVAPGLCCSEEASGQLELPPATRDGAKAQEVLDHSKLSIEAFVDTQSFRQHRCGLLALTLLKLDVGEVVEDPGDEPLVLCAPGERQGLVQETSRLREVPAALSQLHETHERLDDETLVVDVTRDG